MPDDFYRGALQLSEIIPLINTERLFRFSWGGNTAKEYNKLKEEELKPLFNKFCGLVMTSMVMDPHAIWRIFDGHFENGNLIVRDRLSGFVMAAFPFPGITEQGPARFVRARSADEAEPLAFYIVTTGLKSADFINSLGENSADSYLWHGFFAQAAEACAEYVTRRLRAVMGLGSGEGRRFSFGYPGCPELFWQRALFDIVGADEGFPVALTPQAQMVPEHSTSGFFLPKGRAAV